MYLSLAHNPCRKHCFLTAKLYLPFFGRCRVTRVLSSMCPETAAAEGLRQGPCRAHDPSWSGPGAMLSHCRGQRPPLASCLEIYTASHRGAWSRCVDGPVGLILITKKIALQANGSFLLFCDTQPKDHHDPGDRIS